MNARGRPCGALEVDLLVVEEDMGPEDLGDRTLVDTPEEVHGRQLPDNGWPQRGCGMPFTVADLPEASECAVLRGDTVEVVVAEAPAIRRGDHPVRVLRADA